MRQAIHRFKFEGERYLAVPLAGLMAATWQQNPISATVLVPVPLSRGRLAQRGYNQSALLAAHLGKAVGIPVNNLSLRRVREAPPQMGLHRAERLANLAGAFAVERGALRSQRVCLIDDVTTTGATLATCAAALREAGAASISAFVLAKTR